MFSITVFAALLAVTPSVLAQDASASTTEAPVTICRTAYDTNSPTSIPTYTTYNTTTRTVRVNVTTQDTVTITPNATTSLSVVTEVETVTETVTSTPVAATIATPANFLPLIAVGHTPIFTPLPSATAIPRYKRNLLDGLGEAFSNKKRQTPQGNTAGFRVNKDGSQQNLTRGFEVSINCTVSSTTTTTSTSTFTLPPSTTTAPQSTATVFSTTTQTTTTTITEVLPRATQYAACGANNVVDHIDEGNHTNFYFDEVIYKPKQGFPIANELVSNATSAENCCISCQKTANCAGSFYYGDQSQCHLRLTSPPVSANGTANATQPSVCSKGSNTLYIGVIYGAVDQPEKYALTFSNGPCGRFSWDPEMRNQSYANSTVQ